MAADREFVLHPGRRGLNLRDDPASLTADDLTNALNWRIGKRASLEKRLGFIGWGGKAETPEEILELAIFQPAGLPTELLAYCSDGTVYSTTDGLGWQGIASGLSPTDRPSFAQYLDKIYWSNGVDTVRSWDGSTIASHATIPKGKYLEVWRNRLWVAGVSAAAGGDPRTVYWSAAPTPTDFSNTFNKVAFPDGPLITALCAAPNIGSGSDGKDGVLVFTRYSIHRIIDDTDNADGVILGGANILVDGGQGCFSHRSIAEEAGRIYFLSAHGIHSTDGHGQARLESEKITPIFGELFDYGDPTDAVGCRFNGRYFFSFRPIGQTANNRLLELYLDFPADSDQQRPWMAHEIPASAMVVLSNVGEADTLLFADSRADDNRRVRELFVGGADAVGLEASDDISAIADTGALQFEIAGKKMLRRLLVTGRGSITVSVAADFATSTGEGRTFPLSSAEDLWDADNDVWNDGVWGPESTASSVASYYSSVLGRYLTFRIAERSSSTGSARPVLGLGATPSGGGFLNSMNLTLVPLDC